MKRLIINVRDELEPGLMESDWDYGVHHYAADMLIGYADRKGLCLWDEVARLGHVTEEDLLEGAKDWNQYSHDGNTLIYSRDICMRLNGRPEQERTQDGKMPPNDHEDWFDVQARALQEAAELIIKAIDKSPE